MSCAPNKIGANKGELTLRTSVITHGFKGELAPRGTFFLFGAHGPIATNEPWSFEYITYYIYSLLSA